MHMKRYLFVLVAAIVCSTSLWAVVASPVPFEYTKADGTTVMARMYGDEFHSYIESLDGELLEGEKDAEALAQASLRRSAARRVQAAAGASAFPTIGSPHSLVLLVSFADLDFGETQQDFQDLLTKSGYNHNGACGSCRDYYIASSDSLFSPVFDCFGPFKLSRNTEYYGGNNGDNSSVHAADMVAEACQMAHASGVNFKDYDTDNDGMLDNVFIFFAGHNEAEGGGKNTIWPHASNIYRLEVRLDGVIVGSYACTSEYRGSTGSTRCGVGTFCHEFGHVIGQPDFYDTDYKYYSVGDWDIMASGSYLNSGNNPPLFSAYERMYEGWHTPVQLELPGQYMLNDIPFQKQSFLIAEGEHNLSGKSPNPNEFFILENRSRDNIWDAYLPGHGMLVWHIDYNAAAWGANVPNNGPTLMRMHLEEANGYGWKRRANGEGGRPSDPYPGTNNVTAFSPVMHDGTQLQQPVFNIKEAESVISFTYISNSGSSLRTSVEQLELVTTMNDKTTVEWNPKSFELLGTGMDPESPITVSSNSATFLLYAGETAPVRTSNDWRRSVELNAQADSTIQQRIWVNFRPTKQSCDEAKALLTFTSTSAGITMSLYGIAPRPTYVKTPKVLAAKEITPYSFTARWNDESDAEMYYMTIYQTEEGTTDFVQDFENFDSYAKIHEAGWESNTNLTTTSEKSDGARSLYIKKHGDQITTETYPAPITKMSFWYNAFKAVVDTVGVLEVEAYNGQEWVLEDQVVMGKNSKRATANYEFEAEKNYRAFRLTWVDNGGSGIALDAFTATASQKITYLFKGTEQAVVATHEEKTVSYTVKNLNPSNTYYYQVQCTDLDKGCEEHMTDLSEPKYITTQEGKPADGKQLTIGYDSINYNPATHAIYVAAPQDGDYLYIYTAGGSLVTSIPLYNNVCIYPLDLKQFQSCEVYLIQHAVGAKLGRKNKWVKFVY